MYIFVRVSAVRMCTVPVWGLGMNGLAFSFVRASAVRMCTVPVLGLGMAAYSLPTGCTARIYTGLVRFIILCTCGTVFGLGSASSVSCTYVCMCVYGGRHVQTERCTTRHEYVYAGVVQYWHGGLGDVRSIHEGYLHVYTVCVPT